MVNQIDRLHKKIAEALKHAEMLPINARKRFFADLFDGIENAIWWSDVPCGPEATRDEVGFDRSPQRDCRNMRVMPA